MKKNLTQIRDENEGAFTLVELLVVILIIGILAAIAIPAFLNQRKAAVDSSVQSDVKNAATQVETWAISNPSGTVPALTFTDGGAAPTGAVGSLADIKISDGTTLEIVGTGVGEYTITGTNDGGNEAETGITYNSTEGGL